MYLKAANFFLHLDTTDSWPQFIWVLQVRFLFTVIPRIFVLSTGLIFFPYLSFLCRYRGLGPFAANCYLVVSLIVTVLPMFNLISFLVKNVSRVFRILSSFSTTILLLCLWPSTVIVESSAKLKVIPYFEKSSSNRLLESLFAFSVWGQLILITLGNYSV